MKKYIFPLLGLILIIIGGYLWCQKEHLVSHEEVNDIQVKATVKKDETPKSIGTDPVNYTYKDTASPVYMSPEADLAKIDKELDQESQNALEKSKQRASMVRQVKEADSRSDEILSIIFDESKSQLDDEQMAKFIDELVKSGDLSVPVITDMLNKTGDTKLRLELIAALKKIGSDDAKDTLSSIALGNTNIKLPHIRGNAAQAYCTLSGDSQEIALLLDSKDRNVKDVAVESIVGKKLSGDTVAKLGDQLTADHLWPYLHVPSAFAKDATYNTARQKIDVLLATFPNISKLKYADRLMYGEPWTESEAAYRSYVFSMSIINGCKSILRNRLTTAKAPEKEAITIALAYANVNDIHNQLVNIIKKSNDGAVRALAVEALVNIVNEEDIALLRNLMESDPFKRLSERANPEDIENFPVRMAAKNALIKIQSNT